MNIQASQRIQGLPPYAFKQINDEVAALRELANKGEALEPIDFGVGDPSEPTPEFIQQALMKAAESQAETGYPSYVGSPDFREAVTRYLKRRFNLDFDPETEVCSNIGSKEAIFNFPLGFINPGDIVIVPSPAYPPMKNGTRFAGGEVYFAPLLPENDFLIDYESIPEEIAEKAKIIWCNYPNNPTGAVATREFYEGLVAWAEKHDIIIASDEGAYIDIFFEKPPLSILEVTRKGVVVFYSLSKRNNMTGYRIGFVAGDPEIMAIYKQLKTNIDSGAANTIQQAAIVALDNHDHAAEMRKHYKEKAEILYAALENMGLEVKKSPATFFVWQKIEPSFLAKIGAASKSEESPDITFAKKLLDPEIAIVVTPGSLISDSVIVSSSNHDTMRTIEAAQGRLAQGDMLNPGSGYVRFALMPTIEEFHEAVKRLQKVVV